MILTARIPRFPLLITLRATNQPLDGMVALGPQPGDPQVVGICTPAAEAAGIRSGLRIGEALARCPGLILAAPDPGAVDDAAEAITERLERLGADVETTELGTWRLATDGLERLHGGLDGVIRRVKAALPVGMDGRIGIAPTPFASFQAATCAPSRTPLVVHGPEVRAFLAPLPSDRLPLDQNATTELAHLGLTTIGQVADLPRSAVVDRLGLAGLRAWNCANGADDERLRPRTPPAPLEAAFHFPEPVGSLPALDAATRLLLTELATAARNRGKAIRTLTLRAWLDGGGSWTRTLTLREATAEIDRLATAATPSLAEVSGPVDTLVIRADASGTIAGRQLVLTDAGTTERNARTREAVRQIRCAQGDDAILQLVELEPWSRLPERQWALVPYDASTSPDQSA